ncbi:hypothetical protein [Mycobacterium marinum]|uniref:hypothetical protein n=1 Tax=Mycobacterium marinum TaxID=1781 RepID=UPI0018CB8744|nr:hypothetical protein [Mycobacterium marinum]MDC9005813.1 hypothetical protein [Mycobacterium marinum]
MPRDVKLRSSGIRRCAPAVSNPGAGLDSADDRFGVAQLRIQRCAQRCCRAGVV